MPTQETFNSSTTWVCPAGVSQVLAECWGGGASARHSEASNGRRGGAGGGGFGSSLISVIPGNTYTVTVGAGGIGGSGTFNGASGGDSWFSTNTDVLGKGSPAPTLNQTGSPGATSGSCIGNVSVFGGGTGGSAVTSPDQGGGGGGGPSNLEDGSNGSGSTLGLGGTGTDVAFDGGNGGFGENFGNGNGPATNGNAPGGGAGGCRNNDIGGTSRNGGNGMVVLTYLATQSPETEVTFDSEATVIVNKLASAASEIDFQNQAEAFNTHQYAQTVIQFTQEATAEGGQVGDVQGIYMPIRISRRNRKLGIWFPPRF